MLDVTDIIDFDISSPEKDAGKTELTRAFIERLKRCPELMPSNLTEKQEMIINNPPKQYDPRYDHELDDMASAEVYFGYKEVMARKGVTIFDLRYESKWVSEQVVLDRAFKFIEYLKAHPALLPDGITPNMLDQPKLIEQGTKSLSIKWGILYTSLLSGIEVKSPDQEYPGVKGNRHTWGQVLSCLLAPLRQGSTNDNRR